MHIDQIPGKRGPSSRFVIEAKHEPWIPKRNSRQSIKRVVRGWSIQPWSEYDFDPQMVKNKNSWSWFASIRQIFKVFVRNIDIQLWVKANTSRLFFIGSYMNNRRSREVKTNNEAVRSIRQSLILTVYSYKVFWWKWKAETQNWKRENFQSHQKYKKKLKVS